MRKPSPQRPDMGKVTRSFERRREAALRKVHLPTVEDLLYGMPFYGGDLESDVREFANRSVAVAGALDLPSLQVALTELSMSASLEGVDELAQVVHQASTSQRVRKFEDNVLLRRRIYLAAWGDSATLSTLAMETISAAFNQLHSPPANSEAYLHLMFRAMELLASAAASQPFETYLPGNRIWHHNDPDTNLLRERGIRKAITRLIVDEEASKDSADSPSSIFEDLGASKAPAETSSGPSLVAIPTIGNSKTSEGKVATSYAKEVAGLPLPLVTAKDLHSTNEALLSEFPYASAQIRTLLESLTEHRPIRFRPTIIVGDPGSGKSHFCRRLMEALGLHYTMVPFAGISDSAFIGTARRYATGEPSMPVSTIVAHKIANPGLILDEVEKAGTGNQNGNALESMLPMLEGVTASAYQDPYLQARVDIGHVNWLMTANSLSPLSRPFRDRCRIVQFPSPTKEHIGTYVSNILPLLARDRGQPVEMFRLEAPHWESLQNWTDGSFRTLRKMLEAIIDEHEIHGRRSAN